MEIATFITVYPRIFGFFIGLMFLNPRIFPLRIKSALAAILAVIVSLYLSHKGIVVPHYSLLGMFIIEFLVGVFLGFVTSLFLVGLELTGAMYDISSGFSMANMMDPVTGQRTAILGQYIGMYFATLFFASGGFELLLKMIIETYRVLPLGSAMFTSLGIEHVVWFIAKATIWGMSLALPLTIVVLVLEISLGLINRGIGNIPIFILWLPIRTFVALFLLVLLMRPLNIVMIHAIGMQADILQKYLPLLR
ncbi:MAG: flagellar biosynthetic protein FliR [Dictyoglomi bacterium]|nr:flagellar biosynthetic protein FliR [Dictyoglomota bacterium]